MMHKKNYQTKPILTTVFAVSVTLASHIGHATSWPYFGVPDVGYLNQHDAVRTANCPKGYAKLIPGQLFPIADQCTTWCPKDWYWISESTYQCIPLTAFQFQGFEFSYERESGHHHVLFTTVSAIYGESLDAPAFHLTFTTPPHAWDCYSPPSSPGIVGCANDI